VAAVAGPPGVAAAAAARPLVSLPTVYLSDHASDEIALVSADKAPGHHRRGEKSRLAGIARRLEPDLGELPLPESTNSPRSRTVAAIWA
jgi:hypothetical protein